MVATLNMPASCKGAVGGTVSHWWAATWCSPTANFNSPASYTYVSDGNGGTATATVDVTVTAGE
jgi:hypothetical protein